CCVPHGTWSSILAPCFPCGFAVRRALPSFPTRRSSDLLNAAGSSYAVGLSGTGSAPPDTTPPTVAITAPSNGATVAGTITLSATVTNANRIVGVRFKLDGAFLGTQDTTAPYSVSWNTTTVANGSHTLTAVARDAGGNITTSSVVTVTVANPTVSILAPLNGETLTNLTQVTVQAASGLGLSSIQ